MRQFVRLGEWRNAGDCPDVIPVPRALGIGLVSFAPLSRGFLTGAGKRAEDYPADDTRHNDERYQARAL